MLIDWFTVGAQALNFAILVWLMKRFLYKPILDAIDSREKGIAAALADADERKAEAHKERDEFERKNSEFDAQRAEMLSQATHDADAERKSLLAQARQDAQALSTRHQEALQADAKRLNQALAMRTQQEVFAIARKTLGDLASASLEVRATEVFVTRLRAMAETPRQKMLDAMAGATPAEPALVRSAFDLPAEQRKVIQIAVNEVFAMDLPLRFETVPELIGGIELSAKGRKLSWSIAGYLASLQEGVGDLIEPGPTPDVASP